MVEAILARRNALVDAEPGDSDVDAFTSFLLGMAKIWDWNLDFDEQRPLLEEFNRRLNPFERSIKLLVGEIDELSECPSTGIFAGIQTEPTTQRYALYMMQELSDVVLFCMTAAFRVDCQLNWWEVTNHLQGQQAELGIEPVVAPAGSWLEPQALLDEVRRAQFNGLVAKLQQYASQLQQNQVEMSAAQTAAYQSLVQEKIGERIALLEQTAADAVTALWILGVDAVQALIEKIARNNAKYPAFEFRLPPELIDLGEILTESQETTLHDRYRAASNRSKDAFDGKPDEHGHRPGWGTTQFYAPASEAVTEFNRLYEFAPSS